MASNQGAYWPGWETTRLIGRGSFGAVYEIQRKLFEDDDEAEKAALKVISIPQNDSDIEEMYSDGYDEESVTSTFHTHLKSIVAEYSLMRKMNGSSNIVNCDDVRYVQHDDGIGWDIYIKMELLTPLAKALPAAVSEDQVIKIAKDMCAALELCQKHNIIHRDIKPQNIFVSENGDYKLGDFGIAKTVEKTMGGTKTGTYKYMAPEVYSNRPYNSTADIYSTGLVLYWLLNERRMPFMPLPPEKLKAGMDEESRSRRFAGEKIPAPKNGSKELQEIVLKACAFDPKERYQSAREMREDLLRLSGGQAAEFIPEPKPTPILDVQDDTDDNKTMGPIFKHTPVDDADGLDKTVGPIFDHNVADDLDKGNAIEPNTKSKKEKGNKTFGVVAALLAVGILCSFLFFEKDTPAYEGDSTLSQYATGETTDNLQVNGVSPDNFLSEVNQNMSDIVANENVGAVIDDGGQLWIWNDTDMIAIPTSVNNVAGLAVPAIEIGGFDAIYFVGIDGTLGFIEYDAANNNFGQATYLEAPVPIIDVEAFGWDVYAIGSDGCLYQYNVKKTSSPTKTDFIPSFTDLQIFDILLPDSFELAFIARSNEGEYYGWGYNAFGEWGNLEEANIVSPVKLSIPSGLQSAYFFKRCGTSELMCAAWGTDQTVSISNTQGITGFQMVDCTAVYARGTAVYMVQGDDLIAYGRFASGHKLDEKTNVFSDFGTVKDADNTKLYIAEGLGAQIKSFSAEKFNVVMRSVDGHIRTWGGRRSDRFLKNADGSDFVLTQSTAAEAENLEDAKKTEESLIWGLDMTLEEFEQRSTELLETASTWTMETAPQTLNDFPLFPPSVVELFETVKSAEEEMTVSDSMLIWNSELPKILPETNTGMKYSHTFDYVDSNKNSWIHMPVEATGNCEYTVQLPENVWGPNNRDFKLSIDGHNYFDGWNEVLQVSYPISSKQIDGASFIGLIMSNSQYSVAWYCYAQESKIKVDIYSYSNGRIWIMTYDAVSGSLINMSK